MRRTFSWAAALSTVIRRYCRYTVTVATWTGYWAHSTLRAPKLVEVTSTIRQELKKERTAKLTRQVSEKYESNRLAQEAANTVSEAGVDVQESTTVDDCAVATITTVESGASNTVQATEEAPRYDSEAFTTEDEAVAAIQTLINKSEMTALTADIVEMSLESLKEKIEDSCKKCRTPNVFVSTEVRSMADKSCSTETKTLCDKAVGTEEEELPGGVTFASQEAVEGHAKALCQEACHLVGIQIVKVQRDLEEKWQQLKDAGKLRVLQDEEEEQEQLQQAESDVDTGTKVRNHTAIATLYYRQGFGGFSSLFMKVGKRYFRKNLPTGKICEPCIGNSKGSFPPAFLSFY